MLSGTSGDKAILEFLSSEETLSLFVMLSLQGDVEALDNAMTTHAVDIIASIIAAVLVFILYKSLWLFVMFFDSFVLPVRIGSANVAHSLSNNKPLLLICIAFFCSFAKYYRGFPSFF
jgi:hypothetical protein